MEIRNVQRTGNMHYVYLPTNWCKKNEIDSNSKVFIDIESDGKLIIANENKERKKKSVEFNINGEDTKIIHKLIVGSYINPFASFKIILNKELNMAKLLEQKKLISIESVELDGKTITCESNIIIGNPHAILKTMVNKTKNLLIILKNNYNKELIDRYEEEIDRSRLLVDKAVIGFFTNYQSFSQKPIEIHYISLLVKDLERLVDSLILLDKNEKLFFNNIFNIINFFKKMIDNEKELNQDNAIKFAKMILNVQEVEVKKSDEYLKIRIKEYLISISEVIIDYSITKLI